MMDTKYMYPVNGNKSLRHVSMLLLVMLFWALQLNSAYAQNRDEVKKEALLRLDPKVRYGKLKNGFTYYIRNNKEPQSKILMSLVVKVGVFYEDEDQMELAHFMEHMALKGTKHFPNLFADLARLGLTPGKDVNGLTNTNYTQYDLSLPVNNPKIFETGLQIIHDFATDIQFDQESINSEREVMLGEHREKQSLDTRMENQYLPKLYNRFQDHSNLEVEIRKFKPESLVRFYKDWYRPDLQALIIVGDIEVDKIEQEIRSLFSDLKNPEHPKPRQEYNGVNLDGRNQLIIATDKELNDIDINLYIKQPGFVRMYRSDYKKAIIRDLYNSMMSQRFSEISNQYNAPWNWAWSTYSANPIPSLWTHISIDANSVKPGFQAAIRELERAKRFGFSQKEIRLAKNQFFIAHSSEAKIDSHSLAQEYINNYVTREAAPGIDFKWNLTHSLIREINATDINMYIKQTIAYTNLDIVLNAPEKEKASLPNGATLHDWILEIQHEDLKPYKETLTPNSLFTVKELAGLRGKIDSSLKIKKGGITELRLSNGVRVVLKPFKPVGANSDKILLDGFSMGGASLYTNEDHYSALYAASIVLYSGVGSLDKLRLYKYLSGKTAMVIPYIKHNEEGITGSSTINDFETMMQLIHLYFTSPRMSEIAFKDWKKNQTKFFQQWNADLHHLFLDSIAKEYHYANEVGNASELEKINLKRSFDIYKERFADAGDFTFVITGNFDPMMIAAMVTKYLGSLPAKKSRDATVSRSSISDAPISKVFYTKQKLEGAMVELDFTGSYNHTIKDNVMLTALCRVLNIKLFDRLRTREGGVYFVVASADNYSHPGLFKLKIEFACAPEQVEKLVAATLEEIKKIKSDGPDAETFNQAISRQKSSYEYHSTQNDYWLVELVKQYKANEDPAEISQREEILKSLSTEDLKNAAKKYLDDSILRQFVLQQQAETEPSGN